MDATAIVYISAEAIVGLITIIGNCLVLTAIIKTRRLHTITNVFVGNLAIADIAVGVLVAPCAALSFIGLPKDFYGCVFINCLILMFTNISILMLLSVAIERFIAIKEPFWYHRLLTVRRAILVNVCVWILGSVLGLMPMYGWHGGYTTVTYCKFTDMVPYQYMVYFQFFGLVLLPLFFMLCIYVYILIIVRRHMRQTNALHNRFQQNNSASDVFNKDVRAAKMFALVILMFGIFWFPVNIFNCVSLFCGNDCIFPKQALLAAIVMSHANSSINPFLYATSNSRIKGAIKELFGIKLSPDERSSTDHNNQRHVTNGTPRTRENVVSPILHKDNSSNNKDDVPSNTVKPDEFHPHIVELPVEPTDQPREGDSGTTPNNIKQVVNNNDIRHSFNLNIHTRNHSHHASNLSLSSISATEKFPERQAPVPHHPQNKIHLYSQTNDNSDQSFFQMSTTSPLSQNHCRRNKTDIDHRYIGHPNLAFVDADMFRPMEEEVNHVTTCDKTIEGSKIQILSENHSRKNLDMWDSGDHDTIEPFIIYRQFSIGPYHSSRLSKCQESSSSFQSNEVLMVKMFNSSISPKTNSGSFGDHRADSSKQLELCVNAGEDTRTDYNLHKEIHTGHQAKTNNAFTSSVFVDECVVLRNAKTEHTKL